MKVTSTVPQTREITISAPIDELADLVEALRSPRRSRAQLSKLHQLATLIVESDPEVDKLVASQATQSQAA